jgi:TolA-binding protein
MTHSRLLTIGGVLIAGATMTLAQPAPPVPPAPPAPAAVAAPAPAPRAFTLAGPIDVNLDLDLDQVITPEMQDRLDQMRDRLGNMRFELNDDVRAQIEAVRANADRIRVDVDASRIAAEAARDAVRFVDVDAARLAAEAARDSVRAVGPVIANVGRTFGNGFAFAPQITPAIPPAPPAPAVAGRGRVFNFNMSPDRAYSAGQSALDSRHWEDAITYFNQVISRGTNRVDGALYWKAYAQARLGRKDDALATIAELRKSHAGSKWLDEAKALEVEANQGAKPMSAEAETDEDIKVLILQQGAQTDFDRYYPALEKIVNGPASPKLKRNALYVLADSSNPKAQALIEKVARGSGANPDLQVKAIQYMTERRRGNSPNANTGQILSEIYNSSSDPEVKREVIQGLTRLKDKDRLIAILRNEKNTDLRRISLDYFGGLPGNVELWQLYGSESTPEGKIMILQQMYRNGNPDKLVEAARNEKETKVRQAAIRALGSYPNGAELLVPLYANEQDPQVKQSIMEQVFSTRNGKSMVDLAKSEKDLKMKMRMVERMSGRKDCKECQDYLLEILNK